MRNFQKGTSFGKFSMSFEKFSMSFAQKSAPLGSPVFIGVSEGQGQENNDMIKSLHTIDGSRQKRGCSQG